MSIALSSCDLCFDKKIISRGFLTSSSSNEWRWITFVRILLEKTKKGGNYKYYVVHLIYYAFISNSSM